MTEIKVVQTTTKPMRDSNMELLRILSMLLVLVYHVNFLSLGAPNIPVGENEHVSTFIRLFLESGCACCVNVFVLLSGWFGIKPKTNRLCEFLFQIVFFVVVSIIMLCLFADHKFCFDDVKNLPMLNASLWFPKAYLLLYILSPVLNAFVDKAEKKTFLLVLVGFYIFQTLYGWACGGVVWVQGGYSTISFIGLYLLARYFKLHTPSYIEKSSSRKMVLGYFITIIISTIIWYTTRLVGIDTDRWMDSYVSPFVIAESMFLILAFSKLSIKSKFVNWVASSCFAVYLLHCAPNVLSHYANAIKTWNQEESFDFFIVYTVCFVISVFTISVVIDKIRILMWNKIIIKILLRLYIFK